MRRFSRRTRPIGRILRFTAGALLIASIVPYYLRGNYVFNLTTTGIVVVLVVFYVLVHLLVSRYLPGINRWLGAFLALAPVILLYVFGIGGGYVFGAGEGQLGALTFLGASLLLAGVRGDLGCEVMSIPGILFRKRTHLACVVFSPIDWLEQKIFQKGSKKQSVT
jgi:hypothetical protein